MISSPLVEQRTYDVIRQQLSAKGFLYVTDLAHADFAVDFSVGGQDRLDVQSYPAHFGPILWGSDVDVHHYQVKAPCRLMCSTSSDGEPCGTALLPRTSDRHRPHILGFPATNSRQAMLSQLRFPAK